MSDISVLDKNLAVENSLGRSDIDFYNVRKEPFSVYGVMHENGRFCRIPEETARSISDGVYQLSRHTSGGRVCFRTDSDFVAIVAEMAGIYIMPHEAFLGSSGFDLYVRENGKQTFAGAFMPDVSKKPHLEGTVKFPSRKMRDIIINFPLYCGVCDINIGILQGAKIEKWSGYSRNVPMVFYGSSITQGACANAPGTCYASLLSRRFDSDFINLGFSGNGKGEPAVFEYMAGLDMSLFLYDYDYNAPSPEYLSHTHYAGYEIMRKAHPDIPIIMASRPNYGNPFAEGEARRKVIEATYEKALASGDKNVYFADGAKVFADIFDEGATVDGCHPTDYGFRIMAKVFGDIIEKVL